MSLKTSQPQKKPPAKRSHHSVQLTRKELILWLGVIFLAMLWMFTLGVMVGRGISPVRFDIEKLKKELIALKQESVRKVKRKAERSAQPVAGKTEFDFYDVLTEKKKQARKKTLLEREKAAQKVGPKIEKRRASKSEKIRKQPEGQREKETGRDVSQIRRQPVKAFTVQVAALKDARRAKEMVAYLRKKGYDAYRTKIDKGKKEIYHRVRIGHFNTLNSAARAAAKLRKEKFKPIIIHEE